ncbi:MAG: hypothetical protein H0Z18_04825 [Thermococcus sp.]|uniref:hypothetical protein n=1 Tax=Thermococcus sp. TaxID=35749 RepID=UPI001D871147|nr:hypothetical protein [Thermococcus sp.]MBO8174562.1 hypothetical protein [Thermococcus sp.]
MDRWDEPLGYVEKKELLEKIEDEKREILEILNGISGYSKVGYALSIVLFGISVLLPIFLPFNTLSDINRTNSSPSLLNVSFSLFNITFGSLAVLFVFLTSNYLLSMYFKEEGIVPYELNHKRNVIALLQLTGVVFVISLMFLLFSSSMALVENSNILDIIFIYSLLYFVMALELLWVIYNTMPFDITEDYLKQPSKLPLENRPKIRETIALAGTLTLLSWTIAKFLSIAYVDILNKELTIQGAVFIILPISMYSGMFLYMSSAVSVEVVKEVLLQYFLALRDIQKDILQGSVSKAESEAILQKIKVLNHLKRIKYRKSFPFSYYEFEDDVEIKMKKIQMWHLIVGVLVCLFTVLYFIHFVGYIPGKISPLFNILFFELYSMEIGIFKISLYPAYLIELIFFGVVLRYLNFHNERQKFPNASKENQFQDSSTH